MRGLSLGMTLAFGLGWLATVVADAALPMLLDGMPGVAGPAARTVLNWAQAQTVMAMALSAAAYLCFAGPGGRGWGAVALIAILPFLALAVVQFDPRIVARAQELLGPGFDTLRGKQPDLRLGLFCGVSLVGASHLIAGEDPWWPRFVGAVVIATLILMIVGPDSRETGLLVLPALAVLAQAALRLAEHDHPADAYVLIGTLCILAGVWLLIVGDSPRQDLRAGFVLFPLFAALAHRLRPAVPGLVLWGHAILIAAGLAYLAPGFAQFGDVRPATSLAEIGEAVKRAERLSTGIGLMLGLLALTGLILFRRYRQRPHPPEETG